jgi:hypothetical protein
MRFLPELECNKQRGDSNMKKLALGVATAAVLLSAAPAMAQVGFYAGHHGVGVELGAPSPYYDGCGPYGSGCSGYYDYYDGPSVVVGGWRGGWHHEHGHFHGHN